MTTPEHITNRLNRHSLTVHALSQELGISRNSVHVQVSKLEAAGIIEKFRSSPTARAGKPAWHYRLTPGKEDIHSLAYKPVLVNLVQTLSASLPDGERAILLETTGRAIAKSAGLIPTKNLKKDIQRSVDIVNELGAHAEVLSRKKQLYVSCSSCPVATAVHSDPLVCGLVAGFFSEATGRNVTIECQLNRTVTCGFSFT